MLRASSDPEITTSTHWVILAVIIASAIVLRFYCLHGFVGLDDAEYAKLANGMARGTFSASPYSGPAVFPLRVGLIFPTSLLFRFFGVGESSMLIYPFLVSILFILLAYVCTRHFFGNRAGLIAAAIWATLPLDLINATKLQPDLPGAFFASLAVVIVLLFSRPTVQGRPKLAAGGALAGLFFGFSWLCKEAVVYLVPFCIILVVMGLKADREKNITLWSGVAAGSFAVLAGEMVVYHAMNGDWLFRFHETERNYRQCASGFFTEGSNMGWVPGENYLKALAKRLFLVGPETIFLNSQFLFMPLFGLVASAHALYWRNRSFLIPALWLVTLVIMFNFSSSSLSSYLPLSLLDRYLYPVCLPGIVLTAGFIDHLIRARSEHHPDGTPRERFFWGILLATVLVLFAGYSTFRNVRDIGKTRAWASEVRAISAFIKPQEQIYTDPISEKGLKFFWRYPEETHIVNFEDMKSQQFPAKSLVLLNRSYADWLHTNAGMWLTRITDYKNFEVYRQTPRSWKTIWHNGNAHLYRVE